MTKHVGQVCELLTSAPLVQKIDFRPEMSLVQDLRNTRQGPVVRKSIDANPALKLNRIFNLFRLKDFEKLILDYT